MRKILFLIISAAAFVIMTVNIINYDSAPIYISSEKKGYRESFNDEINMKIARNIAAKSNAERVAVIGDRNGILIGIALPSGTGNRSNIRENAEKMAKKYYPDEKIVVEVQTDKAEKIFDLASYLEKGIPDEILKSRAIYLLQSD